MIINRIWAMPSIWTFRIVPIMVLIDKYLTDKGRWADPFAGETSPVTLTNDIDPSKPTRYHYDALHFLQTIRTNWLEGVLFDPPYSEEQCLRRYTPIQRGTAGRAEYWAKCKDEIARVVKPGGLVLSFCWDSTGMGKNRGFEIIEILLVCHGACHNDTICTVERKTNSRMDLHC